MSTQPKRRTSSSKRQRASHFALKPIKLNLCSKCKKPVKAHYACSFCGAYKDKEAIKIRPSKEERELLKKGKKIKK